MRRAVREVLRNSRAGEFAHVVRISGRAKCLLTGVHVHLWAHERVVSRLKSALFGRGGGLRRDFQGIFRTQSSGGVKRSSFQVVDTRAIVGTTQEFFRKAEERVIYTHDSTQFPFQPKMKNLKTQDRDLIMGIQSFITLKKRRWDRLGKRVSQRPRN